MLESTLFTYDGISSEDMGVRMVNPDGGLYKENFLPTRKIIEKAVAGRNSPYPKRVAEEPLSFPMSFFIKEWGDRDNLREIVRWFDQEYYKPLWLDSNPDRIMYAMIEGSSDLLHNGCLDGHVTFNIRCNSPFMYSQPFTFKKTIEGTYETQISNEGDDTFRPYLKIKKIGNGNINIKTYLEGSLVNDFQLNDLLDGEIIDVDCANEDIKTIYEPNGRYLFDNHNDDWLEFGIGYKYNGENSTKVIFTGNFELEMTYQYVYKSGW